MCNCLKKGGVDVKSLQLGGSERHRVRCGSPGAFGCHLRHEVSQSSWQSTIHYTSGVVQPRLWTGILTVLNLSVRFFSLASLCVNMTSWAARKRMPIVWRFAQASRAMTFSGMHLDAACRLAFGKWTRTSGQTMWSDTGQTHHRCRAVSPKPFKFESRLSSTAVLPSS